MQDEDHAMKAIQIESTNLISCHAIHPGVVTFPAASQVSADSDILTRSRIERPTSGVE